MKKLKLDNFGVNLADKVASFVGSWRFIIWQTVILIIWMFINVDHLVNFDPYPFILMNLLLSSQAAYATPMILMSSNRQTDKDREQMKKDLQVDEDTNVLIRTVLKTLMRIEEDIKLDKQALKDHAEILKELKTIKNELG